MAAAWTNQWHKSIEVVLVPQLFQSHGFHHRALTASCLSLETIHSEVSHSTRLMKQPVVNSRPHRSQTYPGHTWGMLGQSFTSGGRWLLHPCQQVRQRCASRGRVKQWWGSHKTVRSNIDAQTCELPRLDLTTMATDPCGRVKQRL